MGDHARAAWFDRRGNEPQVRMIAVIAVLTLVAAGRSTVSPQNGLDVRPVETTENPRIDVQVEFNPPPIDKQKLFPRP